MGILVERAPDEIRASIQDNPEYWATGVTAYEAVGNLVLSHQDQFEQELPDEVKKSSYREIGAYAVRNWSSKDFRFEMGEGTRVFAKLTDMMSELKRASEQYEIAFNKTGDSNISNTELTRVLDAAVIEYNKTLRKAWEAILADDEVNSKDTLERVILKEKKKDPWALLFSGDLGNPYLYFEKIAYYGHYNVRDKKKPDMKFWWN